MALFPQPKPPIDEIAQQEAENRATTQDAQDLGGEIFNQDAHLLGAIITPHQDQILSIYCSLRDIQMANFKIDDIPIIVLFIDQILRAHRSKFYNLAYEYGGLLEAYLMATGAIESRTFNGIAIKKGEITRINKKI